MMKRALSGLALLFCLFPIAARATSVQNLSCEASISAGDATFTYQIPIK